MRRTGILLALLVLFGTLAVGTGTVRAETYDITIEASSETISQLVSYLNSTAWDAYQPAYNFEVHGNFVTIHVQTMKDYVRLLLPRVIGGQVLWDFGTVRGSVPGTVVFVWGEGDTVSATGSVSFQSSANVTVFLMSSDMDCGDSAHAKVYVRQGAAGDFLVTLTCDDEDWYKIATIEAHDTLQLGVYDQASGGTTNGVAAIFVPAGASISVNDASEYAVGVYTIHVIFSLKDALAGQPLTGVTVKEGDTVLGTLDDGGSLELAKGTHELVFEKTGYWSVTKTIDVQGDTSVSVEMYPSSAAFKLENFPADISIPENTIYTLTFTLSPIQTSATYNTYLSLSGLSDVLEVKKDGSAISPESGKYYLGDISGPTQVSIKFKAGAVGQHGFTITLTSNDAIMSQTYTTTKSVTYTVEPLPFSVQMPSEWQVGENQLRISESGGQSYLITAVLKDSSGNEVWSDSYAFSPYEAHTFSINVPSEGSYTLELQFNGQTAVYDITVSPAITLVTKTLTVSEGGEGVITLHFKNPSSSVQYYTIKVSGGFLPAEINQSISVAPLSEKDVSIAFAVPEDLTYDAYELNVQVLQGDSVVFSDNVAVTIDSGGFTLFGGGSNTPTWAYALLGLLIVGGLVWALRRRR